MTISITSRQRIRQRANFLCEYCHSSEEASTSLFTFDHLIPQSLKQYPVGKAYRSDHSLWWRQKQPRS